MGSFTLDKRLARNIIERRVDDGLETVAKEVLRVAVFRAPVRKTQGKAHMRRQGYLRPTVPITARRVGVSYSTRLRDEKGRPFASVFHLNSFKKRVETITGDRAIEAARRTTKPFTFRFGPRDRNQKLDSETRGAIAAGRFSFVPPDEERVVEERVRFDYAQYADVARLRGRLGSKGSGGFVLGGNLKRNIRITGPVRSQGSRRVITVRSHAPYSVFVEFRTRRTEPQPFLLPALKSVRNKMTRMMRRVG